MRHPAPVAPKVKPIDQYVIKRGYSWFNGFRMVQHRNVQVMTPQWSEEHAQVINGSFDMAEACTQLRSLGLLAHKIYKLTDRMDLMVPSIPLTAKQKIAQQKTPTGRSPD